jgi:hypothetical protein
MNIYLKKIRKNFFEVAEKNLDSEAPSLKICVRMCVNLPLLDHIGS